MGYILAITSAVAFALLGISYKLSDKYSCDKRQVNFLLFFIGGLVLMVWASFTGRIVPHLGGAYYGAVLGALNFVAVIAFREVMGMGRMSTSWTVLNLSLIVPVIASLVFWHEVPTVKHIIGVGLIVAAVVLVGIDMGRTGE